MCCCVKQNKRAKERMTMIKIEMADENSQCKCEFWTCFKNKCVIKQEEEKKDERRV